MTNERFEYVPSLPLRACPDWAGLFVSRSLGRHPDRRLPSFEIIFVRAGVLEIQEEKEKFTVRAGETLLLWAGRRHRGSADSPPGLEFFWVHFELDAAFSQAISERINAEQVLQVPQHTAVANPAFLETLFRHYLNEQNSRRLDPTAAALLISLMLCEIARPPQAPDKAGAAATLTSRADVYIHTHCHEALTASQIADALLCNPSYLSRVYHKHYGRTVTQAVHHYRMEYAQHLLRETDQSVGEIARACGIDDVSYFLKLFKRRTGLTALAYRRLQTLKTVNTHESA